MRLSGWTLAAVAVASVAAGSPALGQTMTQPAVIDNRTDAERHQDRAEALRRAAEERARAKLGYPSVQRDPTAPAARNPVPEPLPAPLPGPTPGAAGRAR